MTYFIMLIIALLRHILILEVSYRGVILKNFSETHLQQFYSNLYDMNRNQIETKFRKIKQIQYIQILKIFIF